MGIFIYLLSIPLLGLAVLSLISRGRRWHMGELLGLSVVLGLGISAVLMFYLSLLGLRPHPAFPWLAIAISLPVVLKLRPAIRFGSPSWRSLALQAVPLLLVLLALVGNVVFAQRDQFIRGDALTIWGMKGRALALEPLTVHPPVLYAADFKEAHHNYPLLLPMLIAGGYRSIGSFDDAQVKLVFPLMLLGSILVAWFGLRRLTFLPAAPWLTAAWLASPALVIWFSTGYADAPLAMFAFGAALYLVAYAQDRQATDLRIATLCCAFAAFTKNEGMSLAIVLLFTAAIWCIGSRADARTLLRNAAIALLILLPWLVFRATLPADDENYPAHLSLSLLLHNSNRLPTIFTAFTTEFRYIASWGILWLAIPIALIIRPRALQQRGALVIWTAIALQLTAYIVAYLITPWNVTDLLNVTVERLLVQLSPLAVIALAMQLHGVFSPCPAPHSPSTTVA